MICFGVPGRRRIGLHRDSLIGRTTVYRTRVLQVVACIYCDRTAVRG